MLGPAEFVVQDNHINLCTNDHNIPNKSSSTMSDSEDILGFNVLPTDEEESDSNQNRNRGNHRGSISSRESRSSRESSRFSHGSGSNRDGRHVSSRRVVSSGRGGM